MQAAHSAARGWLAATVVVLTLSSPATGSPGQEPTVAAALELGTTTSPSTAALSAVIGTSSRPAVTGETADVHVREVVAPPVNVGRVMVGARAGSDAGGGIGPSPAVLELGPSQSATRAKSTNSSTAMTIRPAVLPDGR